MAANHKRCDTIATMPTGFRTNNEELAEALALMTEGSYAG